MNQSTIRMWGISFAAIALIATGSLKANEQGFITSEDEAFMMSEDALETFDVAKYRRGKSTAKAKRRGTASDMSSIVKGVYQPWTSPGITTASPVAFGAGWRDVFVGAGFQHKGRTAGSNADGGIGLGFGLGRADKYVGLETSIALTDLSAFDDGAVNFKLHRLLGKGWAIAVGFENLVTWGTSGSDTVYGVISKAFWFKDPSQAFSSLTLSAGAGNGRFRTVTNQANDTGIGIFATAALRVVQPVSFIVDYTGSDMNLGLSITPLRTTALFINPSLNDILGEGGNGVKFGLSAGFAYNFNS